MMVFGLPYLGFSNWFFGYGYSAYPHLYNRFNTYYTRNLGQHRVWTMGNTGFMTAAGRAFNPNAGLNGGRANWLTNPRQYARPNTWTNTARGTTGRYMDANAGAYHAQSWGSARSFGGGFGGGFHGGGGRR